MGQQWKNDTSIERWPRAHWGGLAEINAFMELYPQFNVQILQYNNGQFTETGLFGKNFDKSKLEDPNTLTLLLQDMHYQNLKVSFNPESSGGEC